MDSHVRHSLNEALGYAHDAKLVVLSCDDLGAFHASNEGVLRALHEGSATCASLMVPTPWARHAVQHLRPGDDIGVHITLVSEHPEYRWGPLTYAPSLQSGDGGFPSTLDDLWEHADPEEVRRECRAQVERAMQWGVDVTHLAPHLTAITLRPEFFGVYLDVAVEYRLPVRLPSSISANDAGFDFRGLAREEGVFFPDHFDHDWSSGSRTRVMKAIASLQAGVTEIHVQPVIDSPEVRALGDVCQGWIDDFNFVTSAELRDALRNAGATLIGYRDIRNAMRAASARR